MPNADLHESPLHMTFEHVDSKTGLRFSRTYFLSGLVAGESEYFKDVIIGGQKTQDVSEYGLRQQRDTKTLLYSYFALISAYHQTVKSFLTGKSATNQL